METPLIAIRVSLLIDVAVDPHKAIASLVKSYALMHITCCRVSICTARVQADRAAAVESHRALTCIRYA